MNENVSVEKNPQILLALRIKNNEYSLGQFWASVINLDYPKKNIHIYIIENDSTIDDTPEICDQLKKDFGDQYGSFKVSHLNLGMEDVIYRERRITNSTIKYINNIIFLFKNRFYPYAKGKDCQYVFVPQADIILDSTVIKKSLQEFTNNPKLSWVAGVTHDRAMFGGQPAVYALEMKSYDKPWRLMPGRAFEKGTADLLTPKRITKFDKPIMFNVVGYGVSMMPTQLCLDLPLTHYPLGDTFLSYIEAAREQGYTEALLSDVNHTHIDRDGSIS